MKHFYIACVVPFFFSYSRLIWITILYRREDVVHVFAVQVFGIWPTLASRTRHLGRCNLKTKKLFSHRPKIFSTSITLQSKGNLISILIWIVRKCIFFLFFPIIESLTIRVERKVSSWPICWFNRTALIALAFSNALYHLYDYDSLSMSW